MSNIIKLTDAAVSHIQNMISQNKKNIGFRLSIKKTGCSGFAYVPEIIDIAKPDDIYFLAQQDLLVYIDPTCVDFIKNLIVDYVEEQHAGLKQKRLVFINPNEKNRCGCGESFTM